MGVAEVAEAKEAFLAEFKNVEAGGLMAKQAPAPVHEVAKVEVPQNVVYNALPYMVYQVPQVYNTVKTVKAVVPTAHTYAVPHHYAYTYPYHVMPVVQAAVEPVKDQE